MAKFYGMIGFAIPTETRPGVWEDVIEERPYYGDIIRNTRRVENGESVNDDIVLSNTFSIVADAYAYLNFFAMRYIEFMNSKWKINTVEVNRPRLVIYTGGVYNGPTPETTASS